MPDRMAHETQRRNTVQIEHVAIWTAHLERLCAFYEEFFDATPGAKYINARKNFESHFLRFSSGARLELMRRGDVSLRQGRWDEEVLGYAHLAFSVGSEAAVDALTLRLRTAGHQIVDGPRWTGDGYYESVVLDPDGNRIEITV
jgi:lactoylglutathione lyase